MVSVEQAKERIMGFGYRRVFKAGPIRITASKSGLSYSAGVKRARITKRADGRVQTTVSAPRTGARCTTSTRSRPKAANHRATSEQQIVLKNTPLRRHRTTAAHPVVPAPRASHESAISQFPAKHCFVSMVT
jgi:Protein of unknown function (DUF4236)